MGKEEGYPIVYYSLDTKRYCQTLELVDDPQLIEEYKRWHDSSNFWKEIAEGIRSVGILDMEIYLFGTRLFMIVETPKEFEWDSAFSLLATLKRQSEWEQFVEKYQKTIPGAASNEKWQLMDRIFKLP